MGLFFSLFLATVIYERDTGRSRGFGFVTFSDSRHVDLAIEKLTDTVNYMSLFLCILASPNNKKF